MSKWINKEDLDVHNKFIQDRKRIFVAQFVDRKTGELKPLQDMPLFNFVLQNLAQDTK